MKLATLLTVLITLAGMTTLAKGAIVVDLNGGGDYLTIGEGIVAASTGDTILVAPGVYAGELNRDLSFGGKNLVLKAMPGRDPVVMDAEYLGRCLSFENGEGPMSRVEGITFYRGDAVDGGAVYCYGVVRPTFGNCDFVNCVAYRGAAVDCVDGAAPTFVGCMFRENTADAAGGGLRASSGASVTLNGCVFKGNSAQFGGGVIVRAGSDATVDGTIFEDNTADYSAGLRCENAQVTITNSTFSRNDAYSGGGLGSGDSGMVSMSYCSFYDNTSTFRGSGYACGTPATVHHCTFVGGFAPTGSGIFCGPPQGDMVMTYCIVAYGEGPAMTCDEGGAPTVTKCCFYDNAGGATPCGTYSDILYENPLFCGLQLEDLTIHADSVCAPANNPWSEQIGAFGVGCTGPVPVEPTSWAAIKAMYR